jgi:serine/threonine-protein kinase HipA
MARRRKHAPLNVFLNSRFVGRLNREASGAIDFQYDPSWLDWEFAFPVSLSLPLREDRYVGAPVTAVFDNLLPDSDAIRRRVAERVGAAGADAYSLLTAVGRDCVGALQFLPDGEDPDPAGTINGRPVDEDEIAQLLNNLASAPLGLDENQDFRISIAGAQEKTALLYWQGKWCKPLGTTATTHILKPQIGRIPNGIDLSDSIENEYLCLKLTHALGIPSAKIDIGDFDGKRALIVERFDRRWTRDSRLLRLPQEDCCQALSVPPTLKYQSEGGPGIRDILDLLKGSDDPEADQTAFLRAAIVFWLLGATDGHAKNFSIFLNPGGRFRMTPLYDVLSAQPSLDAGQIQRKQMKLAMSAGDKRHYKIDDIMPRHFLQTAEKAGVGASVVQPILDDLGSTIPGAVERVVQSLPSEFPEQLVSSIVGGIENRLGRIEA